MFCQLSGAVDSSATAHDIDIAGLKVETLH
jgi:hypothetical protein